MSEIERVFQGRLKIDCTPGTARAAAPARQGRPNCAHGPVEGMAPSRPLSPSDRAAAHAAKAAAKTARLLEQSTPGAGQYNCFDSRHRTLRGAESAFKSTSRRLDSRRADAAVGDPGTYNPVDLKSLAQTTSTARSHSTSVRMGASWAGFGGLEQRALRLDMGEGSPGPGAYSMRARSGGSAADIAAEKIRREGSWAQGYHPMPSAWNALRRAEEAAAESQAALELMA